MFCKKCGAEIADGKKFCADCGTPVEESKSNNTKILLIIISCVAVIAVICSIILCGVIAKSNTAAEPSTTEPTTPPTTSTTTLAPEETTSVTTTTTQQSTQVTTTTTQKVTTTTKENLDTPYDVYKIAAGGLEAIYRYVAAPSSVRIESATYDPEIDADEYWENEVIVYCTYTNKTGGLNGITCFVSLWNKDPGTGIHERAYKLGDNLYITCYILDDEPNAPGSQKYQKKLDSDKIESAHNQVNWGSIEIFKPNRY